MVRPARVPLPPDTHKEPLGMLDWDDLRTFLMIARHRTLSAAARALGVRQPTMGRRLEALEQRVGAVLLQKTSHGYVLTEAGAAVLANAERVEAEVLAVERLIAGKDLRLEGTVRLTTVEILATEILAPVLAAFRLRHPAVRVEVVAAHRTLNLTKREADVALRLARFTQSDLVVRRAGTMTYGLYAAPSYLARFGHPDWTDGGRGHALILTEPDMLHMPEMRYLRAVVPLAELGLSSNSRLIHRAAACHGIGLACLPRCVGDGAGLVRLPVPQAPPERELWLGVHGDLRHTPRIRAFIEAMQEGLRDAAPRLAPS